MIKGSALPLQKGLNKITSGTVDEPEVIHCDQDGNLIITWLDDTTSTEGFVAGEDRDTKNRIKSAEISTGTFSFAKNSVK